MKTLIQRKREEDLKLSRRYRVVYMDIPMLAEFCKKGKHQVIEGVPEDAILEEHIQFGAKISLFFLHESFDKVLDEAQPPSVKVMIRNLDE